MKIGILGLQGDVREHVEAIEAAGATPVVVRHPEEVVSIDGLIVPGGESTTIGKMADRLGVLEPIAGRGSQGLPIYGTCAGLILLARRIVGRQDAPHRFGLMDLGVRRNAYGGQIESFETDLRVEGLEEPLHAVFIRAPVIEEVGEGVEVLASCDDVPVLVRQGRLLASSFHPEISGDSRLHEMFVEMARV